MELFEPYSRRLASELPGVSVHAPLRPDGTPLCDDFHVTHLLFADDAAIAKAHTRGAASAARRC